MSRFDMEFTLSADDGNTVISERVAIKELSAKNGLTPLIEGDTSISAKTVSEILDAIKEKKTFQLKWTRLDKYSYIFTHLFKNKSEFSINFYFFMRDENNNVGKSFNAHTKDATVQKAVGTDKGADKNQVVDINCKNFEWS